ncbi:MAG TPA: hypothetical protein VNC84_00010 [Gammaproteobacteria bacterium]|nr:hypothetical protein [Gammaproteobacteria bacterium]
MGKRDRLKGGMGHGHGLEFSSEEDSNPGPGRRDAVHDCPLATRVVVLEGVVVQAGAAIDELSARMDRSVMPPSNEPTGDLTEKINMMDVEMKRLKAEPGGDRDITLLTDLRNDLVSYLEQCYEEIFLRAKGVVYSSFAKILETTNLIISSLQKLFLDLLKKLFHVTREAVSAVAQAVPLASIAISMLEGVARAYDVYKASKLLACFHRYGSSQREALYRYVATKAVVGLRLHIHIKHSNPREAREQIQKLRLGLLQCCLDSLPGYETESTTINAFADQWSRDFLKNVSVTLKIGDKSMSLPRSHTQQATNRNSGKGKTPAVNPTVVRIDDDFDCDDGPAGAPGVVSAQPVPVFYGWDDPEFPQKVQEILNGWQDPQLSRKVQRILNEHDDLKFPYRIQGILNRSEDTVEGKYLKLKDRSTLSFYHSIHERIYQDVLMPCYTNKPRIPWGTIRSKTRKKAKEGILAVEHFFSHLMYALVVIDTEYSNRYHKEPFEEEKAEMNRELYYINNALYVKINRMADLLNKEHPRLAKLYSKIGALDSHMTGAKIKVTDDEEKTRELREFMHIGQQLVAEVIKEHDAIRTVITARAESYEEIVLGQKPEAEVATSVPAASAAGVSDNGAGVSATRHNADEDARHRLQEAQAALEEARNQAARSDERAMEADKRAAEADKCAAEANKRFAEADKRVEEADKRVAKAETDFADLKTLHEQSQDSKADANPEVQASRVGSAPETSVPNSAAAPPSVDGSSNRGIAQQHRESASNAAVLDNVAGPPPQSASSVVPSNISPEPVPSTITPNATGLFGGEQRRRSASNASTVLAPGQSSTG